MKKVTIVTGKQQTGKTTKAIEIAKSIGTYSVVGECEILRNKQSSFKTLSSRHNVDCLIVDGLKEKDIEEAIIMMYGVQIFKKGLPLFFIYPHIIIVTQHRLYLSLFIKKYYKGKIDLIITSKSKTK